MYVHIHHSHRPISLIGGYQDMFVSITMIYRLSLLEGVVKVYFVSTTMTDRHRLWGGVYLGL